MMVSETFIVKSTAPVVAVMLIILPLFFFQHCDMLLIISWKYDVIIQLHAELNQTDHVYHDVAVVNSQWPKQRPHLLTWIAVVSSDTGGRTL